MERSSLNGVAAAAVGIHDRAVLKATNIPITSGRTSDYKIIVPKKAAETVGEKYRFAANDLQSLIMEATGAVPEVIAAGSLRFNADAKYISIGENDFTASAGIEFNKDILGPNGCRILTKGKCVFIDGGSINGAINGVYEFLSLVAGFRIYDDDEIVFDPSVKKNIMFHEMDVTEVPDFQWRQRGLGTLNHGAYARRMRLTGPADVLINVRGLPFHNTFAYIPPSMHRAAHPKWFAQGIEEQIGQFPWYVPGQEYQLCFLARGDAAEKRALDDQFFESLKANVIANPDVDNISITQEDVRCWCRCPACTAEFEKYGTDSATIIKFCNAMSKRLQAWIASDENVYFSRSRVIKIIFFAYQKTVDAPVKIDADGACTPIDSDVVCDGNVYPYYAPIETHYTKPFDGDANKNNYQNLKKWSAIAKHIFLWPYSANFNHYLYPYNSFGVLRHNYRVFKNTARPELIFDLHQHNQNAATGFQEFKWWLATQLMWNTEQPVEALTDEYFNAYFKAAAAPMRKFYDEIRAHMTRLEDEKKITGGIYFKIDEPDYWPAELLKGWLKYIDAAHKLIAPVKYADPLLHKKLKKRIALESIFPRFALIDLHPGSFPAEELYKNKREWKEDVLDLNVNRVAEHTLIENVFNKWQI
ncbi:MAG: DUF4838 domain-containing protein [Clostridiales bacterium]|jgi:hypothetical protein|nr:DUF4838 domain-containing protein [Clostridiales bacterium]